MGQAPTPYQNLPATETTGKELTSPHMSEADHANGFMTAGDQSGENVSSSIRNHFTPKRRMRLEFWNVRTRVQSGRLAKAIHEMNNYNLANMGIAEVRWT